MIGRLTVLLALSPLLAGCFQATIGSVTGGECKIFERPAYVVLGKAHYDQDWIDSQIEGGVGGCHWKRPAVRPASFDAAVGQKKVAAVAKKRSLLKRIKDRAVHPFTSHVAPVVSSPPVPDLVLPPMIEQPKKSRDPVDELLHPEGGQ